MKSQNISSYYNKKFCVRAKSIFPRGWTTARTQGSAKITIFASGGAPIRGCLCRLHGKIKIQKKIQKSENPNPLFGHSGATAVPATTITGSGRGTAAATRTGRWAAAAARFGRGEGGTAPGRLTRAWGGGGGVVDRRQQRRRRLLIIVGSGCHALRLRCAASPCEPPADGSASPEPAGDRSASPEPTDDGSASPRARHHRAVVVVVEGERLRLHRSPHCLPCRRRAAMAARLRKQAPRRLPRHRRRRTPRVRSVRRGGVERKEGEREDREREGEERSK